MLSSRDFVSFKSGLRITNLNFAQTLVRKVVVSINLDLTNIFFIK